MHCRNCGGEVASEAVMCVKCGTPPRSGKRFCNNCAQPTDPNAEVCTKCGVRLATADNGQRDWLTTLLLCLFVGGIGMHRFYTGHTTIGVIQLLTLGGCGIWTLVDLVMIVTRKFVDSEGRELSRR